MYSLLSREGKFLREGKRRHGKNDKIIFSLINKE